MCDDRIYLMRIIDQEQATVDRVKALADSYARRGLHKQANELREALMDEQERKCIADDDERRREDRRLDWWGLRHD